jgi:hypothetical protein
MLNKTKIALVAALVLGTASAVMAADENGRGGSVMPGSSVGVNPVDHPNNPAVQSMKPPLTAEQRIRTEGRGTTEGPGTSERLREEPRKDPQDPGPSDSER